MALETPCYCPNPLCQARQNVYGPRQKHCKSCGTSLLMQPKSILLRQPIYGVDEKNTNSEIFLAESLGLQATDYPQIVKILKPNTGAIARRLFQQEGQLLKQLRGLAVPKVDAQPYLQVSLPSNVIGSQESEVHCLVMEKIQGQSLEEIIQAETITLDQAIDWLRQLAQLLLDIHRRHIIHRDIKPGNIMVSAHPDYPHGKLFLIDFGTARSITPDGVADMLAEKAMTIIQSPGYTAPEQRDGNYTFKSDLYSVGHTFIYLLTGVHPQNAACRQLDLADYISSPQLREILFSLTQEDPLQRCSSAYALLQDIENLLLVLDKSPLGRWFINQRKNVLRGGAIAASLGLAISFGLSPFRQAMANSFAMEGERQYAVGQSNQALAAYNNSLWWNSQNVTANFGKAYLCELEGNTSCAKVHYEKVVEISVDQSTEAYVSSVSNLKLMDIKQSQNLDLAIQELTVLLPEARTLKLEAYVHKNLAWAWLLKEDLPEAIEHFSEAELTLSSHPDVICLRGAIAQAEATENFAAVAQCSN